MSLGLVKKNTSSPFQLQRSIVAQGDENGAYSQGGYNPEAVYDNSGIAAGIASFGQSVGAGLSAITKGDMNKMDVKKKERLEKREEKLRTKEGALEYGDFYNGTDTSKKQQRLNNRIDRVEKRKEKTQGRIDSYNEKKKLLGHLLTEEEE